MVLGAILQQRCIHHITSLRIRNLTISLTSDSLLGGSSNESFLYFTLHLNSKTNKGEIFKSEAVPYSPNPEWKNIKIVALKLAPSTNIIVRLWIGCRNGFMPAFELELSLNLLICIGDSLDPDVMTFNSNAVILGMHKTFYACITAVTLNNIVPFFDLNNSKCSYTTSSLQRIFSSIVEARQYKQGALKLRNDSASLRINKHDTLQLEMEIENVRKNINHLEKLLQREKALLSQEKEIANSMIANNSLKEKKLAEKEELLRSDRLQLEERRRNCQKKKLLLSQATTRLIVKRQSLLSDLSLIFPITKYLGPIRSKSRKTAVHEKTAENLLSICHVKLADSEKYQHKDDLYTSIALGYTSQLVSVISQILLVPLRYPINLKGSATTVVDLVTEKMSNRERTFPLHAKGNKERFLFDYGVFLLNKNIADLRFLCGQGTADIRTTLQNVKLFLEERLGARLLLQSPSTSFSEESAYGFPQQLSRISSVGSFSNGISSDADAIGADFNPTTTQQPSAPKFLRSESVPCVSFAQSPGLHARQRSQLLGLNENDSSSRREAILSKKPKFKRMATASSLQMTRNDSVGSVSAVPGTTIYLSGLEQSSIVARDAKMSLADARAALLGKKTEKRKSGFDETRTHKDEVQQKAWSYSDSSRRKSSLSSDSMSVSTSSLTRDNDVCDCDAVGVNVVSFEKNLSKTNGLAEEPDLC